MHSSGGSISPFPEELGRILPLQTSGQGFELELDKLYTPTTFPTQQLATRYLSRHGQGSLQTFPQKGHREGKVQQIYEQTVLSPQEKLRGEEDHIGPISPEPIYTTCLIQDAYLERSETPATTRSLDNLHQSKGWLLALEGGKIGTFYIFYGLPC